MQGAGGNADQDLVVLMTDGPEARVGEILRVPFPRPRERAEVLEHSKYYACRTQIIDFLESNALRLAAA